jgi:fructokinase
MRPLVENADIFVFGSLAARNKTSKNTLFRLLEIARHKVLDLNLRAPHFNRQIIQQLLEKADLLKMNLAELEMITGWYSGHTSIEDRVKTIRDKFGITDIVVTMGAEGALLYQNGQITTHHGFKIEEVDTVGSGDAFLAGLLAKLLDNAAGRPALQFASALGALIATKRGACPDYEIGEIEELIRENNTKI